MYLKLLKSTCRHVDIEVPDSLTEVTAWRSKNENQKKRTKNTQIKRQDPQI